MYRRKADSSGDFYPDSLRNSRFVTSVARACCSRVASLSPVAGCVAVEPGYTRSGGATRCRDQQYEQRPKRLRDVREGGSQEENQEKEYRSREEEIRMGKSEWGLGFCSLLLISVYQWLINLLFEMSKRRGDGWKIKRPPRVKRPSVFYSECDIIYR